MRALRTAPSAASAAAVAGPAEAPTGILRDGLTSSHHGWGPVAAIMSLISSDAAIDVT